MPPPTRTAAIASARRAVNSSATDVFDEEPVGGGARLGRVAHLGDHRSLHGGVEVGVGEHDERRVAAEFHHRLEDPVGGPAQQHPADLAWSR